MKKNCEANAPASFTDALIPSFTPGMECPPTVTCPTVAGCDVKLVDSAVFCPSRTFVRYAIHGFGGATPKNPDTAYCSGSDKNSKAERVSSTRLSATSRKLRIKPPAMVPPIAVSPNHPDLSTMSMTSCPGRYSPAPNHGCGSPGNQRRHSTIS